MEEKKLDVKSLVGFGLIALILIWMIYNQTEQEEAKNSEKDKQEHIDKVTGETIPEEGTTSLTEVDSTVSDSVNIENLKSSLGAFAYSASLPSAKDGITELENELLDLKIANKGGYISSATLKNFEQFRKGSNQRVELIKDNNADFNLQFQTKDNRILNTRDLYFEPEFTKEGENKVLTMRLKAVRSNF